MTRQVDVLLYESRARVVREGVRLLQAVYEGGKKDPNGYHLGLFILSYNFTDIGEVGDAMKLLGTVPPEWFRKVLPLEIEENPLLMEMARRTADALVKEKYATGPVYDVKEQHLQPGVGKS